MIIDPEESVHYSQTLEELEAMSVKQKEHIVENFLYADTYNIAVGRSGIGKSPLMIQLALCVAFGKPFLGLPVKRGRVLIADYENGASLADMIKTLAKFLEIDVSPTEFNQWFRIFGNLAIEQADLEQTISWFQPALVVVDAFRGYDSDVESSRHASGVIKTINRLILKYHFAFIAIHHPRKQDLMLSPTQRLDLFQHSTMEFMETASGHSSLVQQAYTRVGIVAPSQSSKVDKQGIEIEGSVVEGGDLFVKGNVKGRGDVIGPWTLDREYEGEFPVGYTRRMGIKYLSHDDHVRLSKFPIGVPLHYPEIEPLFYPAVKQTIYAMLRRFINMGVLRGEGAPRSPSRVYVRVEGGSND